MLKIIVLPEVFLCIFKKKKHKNAFGVEISLNVC